MIAILEKSEHNIDFHKIVDFIKVSHISPKSTGFNEFSSNIATVVVCLATNRVYNFSKMIFDGMGEGSVISTKPHHTPSPQEKQSSHHDTSLPSHPTARTEPIPTTTPIEIPTLRQYFRRATWIAQSKALSHAVDVPASLLRDDSQGEAFPTVTSLDTGQDKENIIKTFALPHESTPWVTSLDADEGNLEISGLKARIKLLEDKYRGSAEPSGDDASIKGRSMEIRKEVGVERSTELGSNDTEEMVNVLSSMEAANILTSEVAAFSVPPVVGVSTVGVPTVSGLFPMVSAIFTTASVVTPYSRHPRGILEKDKGKEKVVESEEPKKKKLQEQIDAQNSVEQELKMLIDGLYRSNEVIAKHLQEYEQSEVELTIGEKIDLINELKQLEDFVPMSSTEEGKRMKRKGLKLDQGSDKRMKTSENVSKEDLKGMKQLVSVEEVYVKALQVKHPFIDWEIHSEGKKDYWKIIRVGGHTAVYQFFVDMLKQFDRGDLH
uniref:Uncharacterized protein n=1 Tax=Tanacetum cinerariifolium TaxID=118510 RepID=A0A699H055_TANCI|nr:hypothetical protein [Tanacetum cinerariifolium]